MKTQTYFFGGFIIGGLIVAVALLFPLLLIAGLAGFAICLFILSYLKSHKPLNFKPNFLNKKRGPGRPKGSKTRKKEEEEYADD